MEMTARVFGERLRELRDGAGLTQVQLAEKAGMHRQGIAKLELGEREPTWQTVQQLAAALGVDCTAFADPGLVPAEALPARPRGRQRKADAGQTDVSADLPLARSKPHARKARRPRGG